VKSVAKTSASPLPVILRMPPGMVLIDGFAPFSVYLIFCPDVNGPQTVPLSVSRR
jgi:hypothetical protein